jgi:hypothetical protein
MTTELITIQLSRDLLDRVQEIAGSPKDLQAFLIQAIKHEVERYTPGSLNSQFWENLTRLRVEMETEGIEIDPDEIWGDIRDRSLLTVDSFGRFRLICNVKLELH